MTRRQLLLLSGARVFDRGALSAEEPHNLSYPLRDIQGSITSREHFFVRDHFLEPAVSIENWSLHIEGAVARPYDVSFSDLLEMQSKKLEAVLECAGNGPHGSAASNGVWEGVPLAGLIQAAEPAAAARYVMLEAADAGRLFDDTTALPYTQLLPLAKCLDPSSLVAFKLNDLLLPQRNGFPARALFPGWYAMDSVKWLQRIVVLDKDLEGSAFHRSGIDRLYNRVEGTNVTRLSTLQVKSAIAWPLDSMKLPAGTHRVYGFAWTGPGRIRRVDVSTDGGKSWAAAQLEARPHEYSWVKWDYAWRAVPGDYLLASRAADDSGHEQLLARDRSRKDGYELNWCAALHCTVL